MSDYISTFRSVPDSNGYYFGGDNQISLEIDENKTFFSDANRCTFDKVPYGINMSNQCYTSLKAWYANSQSKMGGCGTMERAAKQVAVSFGHLVNAFIVDVALIVYDVMMATFFLVANACTLFLSDELRERLGGHLYSAVSVLSSNIFKNVITALYPPAVYRSEDAINVNDQINDPNGNLLRTFPSLHLQMLRTCERNGKLIDFPDHSFDDLFPRPEESECMPESDVLFGWAINNGLGSIAFDNKVNFEGYQKIIQDHPQHRQMIQSVCIAGAMDASVGDSSYMNQILETLNPNQLKVLLDIELLTQETYDNLISRLQPQNNQGQVSWGQVIQNLQQARQWDIEYSNKNSENVIGVLTRLDSNTIQQLLSSNYISRQEYDAAIYQVDSSDSDSD